LAAFFWLVTIGQLQVNPDGTQSWKKLHAVRADIFSEIEDIVVILIYFEVNIEE
jgi:hypothetical protein